MTTEQLEALIRQVRVGILTVDEFRGRVTAEEWEAVRERVEVYRE